MRLTIENQRSLLKVVAKASGTLEWVPKKTIHTWEEKLTNSLIAEKCKFEIKVSEEEMEMVEEIQHELEKDIRELLEKAPNMVEDSWQLYIIQQLYSGEPIMVTDDQWEDIEARFDDRFYIKPFNLRVTFDVPNTGINPTDMIYEVRQAMDKRGISITEPEVEEI